MSKETRLWILWSTTFILVLIGIVIMAHSVKPIQPQPAPTTTHTPEAPTSDHTDEKGLR